MALENVLEMYSSTLKVLCGPSRFSKSSLSSGSSKVAGFALLSMYMVLRTRWWHRWGKP